jgi:hypothetical protein
METDKLTSEIALLRSVLENDEILEIQQTGETESSLDILLIVTPDEYIQAYVRPLGRIGYKFYPENSTMIKLFFQKGDTFKYNLNLTQAN